MFLRRWRQGGMGSCHLMSIEFKFYKMMSFADCITMWMYLTLLTCKLENGWDCKFGVMCILTQLKKKAAAASVSRKFRKV